MQQVEQNKLIIPKTQENLPPLRRRNKQHDLGHDRSDAYNIINQTHIINNHMLDRYLNNKEDLKRMGVKING